MAGTFDLKKTDNGKYMFNLKSGNGQVILTSQLYESRSSALNGIESVRKNAGDDGQYERKTTSGGEPFFVLTATNGQTIGKSESYNATAGMENGIASVKTNAPDARLADNTGEA
ncbi:MAG: YegP family protein [Halioglobus sp.]|jgi:uncharacterized protein